MRVPAVAGRFYPADEDSLVHELESCFLHPLGPGLPRRKGSGRSIAAALAPHAGYRASGMNAAHVYKAIAEDGLPEAYVIIGPDHTGIRHGAALCSEPYLTPMGPCRIHEEIAERLSGTVADDPSSHAFEHSIEVQVPFLQFIDPDPRIVPVVMRDQDMHSAVSLGRGIADACDGFDVTVIASSDLSHYIPRRDAARIDGEFLAAAGDMDIPGMYGAVGRNRMSACGYGPVAAAVTAASPSRSSLLRYSDSFDSLRGDAGRVVGYGSMLFLR